jgi:hypothetical protein
MKTLKVTLEIKVDDWKKEFEEDDEVPAKLADYQASEVAGVLEALNEHTSAELFGGSGVYAQFKECRVIDAAWKPRRRSSITANKRT